MLVVMGVYSFFTGFDGPRAVGHVMMTRAFVLGLCITLAAGWAATLARSEWQCIQPIPPASDECSCGHAHR
jgi:hypothetical protein